ncbi:hypothetical protein OC25_06030 [Pedobacter kyungheensis]|uniref:IPT/TIG domain-containing protein n=1 Tax=Pedobacter kyungheensis TaxID=1069985 RepID=A0A0C1FR12_9SPHI|nr:FG-GAP-like repeat-containing protein [Pedobacter kyungheensis]KIA95397.1 hypothetical protein OC25_06030 [Pedobacter kyungheensis]
MKFLIKTLLVSFLLFFVFNQAFSQLKQAYKDSNEDNEVRKICFYSKTEGYIAFKDGLGYTTDGGLSFQKKLITPSNVNYNGFSANLTFGFGISGVKAFDKNNLIVYGDYGLVPAILTSADGGETFKLVFHQQSSDTKFSHIADMVFPDNGSIGYAADDDRVIKTTNKGQTWTEIYRSTDAGYKQIEAFGTFVAVTGHGEIIRSTNSGVSFAKTNLPESFSSAIIRSVSHLSTSKIWLNFQNADGFIYYSADGGTTWSLKNNPENDPQLFERLKFFDDNLGYGLGTNYTIYKTTNSGKNWEPLPRDNNFSYLNYTHYDAQFWDSNTFWVGGGYGFLEYTTNGGGTPILNPIFSIDISTLSTNTVKLKNYSKSDYSFEWLVNDVSIAKTYDASFQRDNSNLKNKITLMARNGLQTVSISKEITLPQGVQVTDFTPKDAGLLSTVTITGVNFTGATKVTFGGLNAIAFTVVSPTTISALLGGGKSGEVYVGGPKGFSSLPGFNYLPPPTIASFSPKSAVKGQKITIIGDDFINVTSVTFGGTPALSYVVLSSTRIDAVVADGESGDLSVSTLGGSSALPNFLMLPTIESFTPSSGTNGELVVIKGSGFSGTTTVSIGNTPVKSFTVNNRSLISAIVGAAESGPVSVTTKNGTHTLAGFTYYNPPKITDFSPRFTTSGGRITITGSNFSNLINGNIVMFGDIRGKVISCTSTTIEVEVPKVSTFKPLSVTTNSLTAYSKSPFIQSLPGENRISDNSFAEKIDLPISAKPSDFKLCDFDGDGFLDIIILIKGLTDRNELAVYRNKGITGETKFDDRVSLFFKSSALVFSASDIDGDGKPDLAVWDANVIQGVFIYQNTSTTGKISFSLPTVLSSGNTSYFDFKDLDGDGKPDLITGGIIRKNTSSPGNISFANYNENYSPIVGINDFDNDGKLDLITFSSLDKFEIYKNVSTLDKILFTKALEVPTDRPSEFATLDVDGDQKIDIVTISSSLNELKIHTNTGNNSFLFAAPIKYQVAVSPTNLHFHDLDGDGRPDVLYHSEINKSAAVLVNISSIGNPKLAQKTVFSTLSNVKTIEAGDIDQDGKTDIVFQSEENAVIAYLKNKVNNTPFVLSFSPSNAKKGDLIIINGENFNDATAVSFGGSQAAKFVIDSPTQITATLGDGATGSITVSNPLGSSSRPGFSYGLPPIITSISTPRANAGESITIIGKNFSETPSENKVLFGLAYGTVTASTTTMLTVTVPSKATYSPISVFTNGLFGASINSFMLTFPGDYTGFTEKSFSPAIRPQSGYKKGAVGDLDGDGLLDITYALNNVNDKSFHIYHAIKKNGEISYEKSLVIPMINVPETTIVTDMDGDGKPELVTYSPYRFHVFKNTSIPGKISLIQYDFVAGDSPFQTLSDIKIGDFDGDGRIDVAIANYADKKVCIFRNESTNGTLKFGERIDLPGQGWVTKITLQDFNNDGKLDLAYSSRNSNQLVIHKNTSIGSQITFDPAIVFPVANEAIDVVAGDLDDDGKADLLVASNSVLVFRNTSSTSTISFAAPLKFADEGYIVPMINLSDLDGDGKVDLFKASGAVSVLKNISQPGTISFAPGVKYAQPHDPILGMAADLDEDGKPDIITFSEFSSSVVLFSKPIIKPLLTSLSPASGPEGQAVSLNGFNFTSVTGVSFGGVPASSFKIESPTLITAIVGAGGSGPVNLSTSEGTNDYLQFKYTPPPVITSFSPMVAEFGETITIKGKNFTEATQVWFSLKTPFTVLDDNTISVTLPSSEFVRSGNIIVDTPYGSSTMAGFILAKAPVISADKGAPYYLNTKLGLSANTGTSFTYEWRKNGAIISGATSSSIVADEGGSYTAAILHNNKQLISEPFTFTLLNTLPSTIFKVKATNETCRLSNNGEISISAGIDMNYSATVTGAGYNKTYNFRSNLNIGSLKAGTYSVCITVAEYTDYKQCFEVTITEPKDLALFSSIVNDKTITLNLGGAKTYHIDLNGEKYTTSNSQITLALQQGSNSLTISSDLSCQGIIKKSISLASGITAYPNPFDQTLTVAMGSEYYQKVVKIDVYDLSGRLVFTKKQMLDDVEITLNLSSFTSGMYILKIAADNFVSQTKILKK